jgi:hypothetical protein
VSENSYPFGHAICTWSRVQAVADGFQVDITRTAQKAGIRFPVFLSRAVFDACVAMPEGATGQDEAGRLWNIVWALRFAIRRAGAHGQIYVSFVIYVGDESCRPKLVKLAASCGALDMDDSQTAITITMPDEE